jgi:branched-chain amino acid transport system substrate-binding protein
MLPDRSSPIKIGLLYSDSGLTAAAERSQRDATVLAVRELNDAGGVLGRELELVLRDPGGVPGRYAAMAEELIAEQGMRLFMGCYLSNARKAVVPVMERHNALLFYGTPYEGFEYSRNVIYTGAAPNQNALPIAEYMLSHFGSRVAMVGSDFVCPHESNRVMNDLISERGGLKVAETYLPLSATAGSYLEIARRIKAQAPDFIFSTVVGEGIALFYRAFAAAGFDPYVTPIASHMTSETEVALMGADLAEGHITCATYFQSVETIENRRAVRRYQDLFGTDAVTNMCWEAAYFQTHLLACAITKAGSDDPDRLLEVLPGMEIAAPQGIVRLDEVNHHAYLHPRIGRVNVHGQFDILAMAPARVKADPYVVSHVPPQWASGTPHSDAILISTGAH